MPPTAAIPRERGPPVMRPAPGEPQSVTAFRLVAEPRADLDVAAAHQWYENERVGLGREFLEELGTAYDRIAADPFTYQDPQPSSCC